MTAVYETFNDTSQPTTLDQPSGGPLSGATGGGTGGGGGVLGEIGSAISGVVGTASKVVSTIGSFDNLEMLANGVVDTFKCALSLSREKT